MEIVTIKAVRIGDEVFVFSKNSAQLVNVDTSGDLIDLMWKRACRGMASDLWAKSAYWRMDPWMRWAWVRARSAEKRRFGKSRRLKPLKCKSWKEWMRYAQQRLSRLEARAIDPWMRWAENKANNMKHRGVQ